MIKKTNALFLTMKGLNRGFTLIEIMIAVSIFAVISAIIFPIVIKTISTNSAIEKRSEEIAGLQRMFVFMENDFRYMVQRTIRDPLDGLSFDPSFAVDTSDGELIKFFTLLPDANIGESQTRLVAWVLDEEKLQRKTWFSISPFVDEEPRFATIVEGVGGIDLRFAEETDGVLDWNSDWDDEEKLPLAAEVVVNFADGVSYRRVFEIADTPQFTPPPSTNNPNNPNNPNAPDAPDAPDANVNGG